MNKMVKMFLASVMVASSAMAAEIKVDQDTDTTGAPDLSVHFQLEVDNAMVFKVVHSEMKNSFLGTAIAPIAGDADGYIHLGKVKRVLPDAALGDLCDAKVEVANATDTARIPFAISKFDALTGLAGLDADTQVDIDAIPAGDSLAACEIRVAGAAKFMDLEIPLVSMYAASGAPVDVGISLQNGQDDGAGGFENQFDLLTLNDGVATTSAHNGLTSNGHISTKVQLSAKVVGAGVKEQYNASVYYDVSQL